MESSDSRRLLEARGDLQDDVVLVQLREHRRDLALREGVVQRVVDVLRGDAEARRRVAVDDKLRLQAFDLLVAGDVGQDGQGLELVDHTRGPHGEFVRVGVFDRVLVLRAGDAVFDREILQRLKVGLDAFDLREPRLQALNDLHGGVGALFAVLQIDLDAAAVQRGVRAVDADKRGDAFDVRVLQDRARQHLLAVAHGGERDGLRGFGDGQEDAGVLHRKEALWGR